MSGAGQGANTGSANGGNGAGQGSQTGNSVAGANGANSYGTSTGATNSSANQLRGAPGGTAGGNSTSGSTTGSSSMAGSGMPSGSAAGMSSSMGQTTGGQPPSGMSGSSSGSSGSSASSASPSLQLSAARDKAKKAMKQRGDNWGLPDASQRATAITRPIYVECYSDRLVLLPDRGEGRAPLVVPVESGVTENLDYVVGTVWQHMDRWGMALLNGYWKPVLSVDVKRGGEAHFAELQTALRGSGIEVEKKP
jgi:hypothetical protein